MPAQVIDLASYRNQRNHLEQNSVPGPGEYIQSPITNPPVVCMAVLDRVGTRIRAMKLTRGHSTLEFRWSNHFKRVPPEEIFGTFRLLACTIEMPDCGRVAGIITSERRRLIDQKARIMLYVKTEFGIVCRYPNEVLITGRSI